MIELTLSALPPSANRIWRRSGNRIHKSSKYQNWLVSSGYEIIAQRVGTVSGPYKLAAQFKRPDKRKRDLDNLIKPLNDLLKSVCVIDDDSLAELVTLRWVTSGPPVTVRLERAGVE